MINTILIITIALVGVCFSQQELRFLLDPDEHF